MGQRLISLFLVTLFTLSLAWGQLNRKRAGKALTFDGTDDYVEVTDDSSLDIRNEITVSVWAKLSALPTDNERLVQKNPENDVWLLWAKSSNNIWRWRVLTNAGKFTVNGPSVQVNTWTYVTGVWNGNTQNMKLYINGQLTALLGSTGTKMDTSAESVMIGADRGIDNFWKGQIDEVRVWNRALTQSEIRKNMTKTLTGNEFGLIGYWRLDEGSGTTANDSSPNGNDGTLK